MRTEDDLRTALAALAASATTEPDTVQPIRPQWGTRPTRRPRKWQGAVAIAAAVAAIAVAIPLTTHDSAPVPVPGPAHPTTTVPAPTTISTRATTAVSSTPAPPVTRTPSVTKTPTVAKGPTVVAQVPPRTASAQVTSKTTTAPVTTNDPIVNVADGQEVGIATPIILDFPRGVLNKAAVARALTVTTSAGAAISGAWVWGRDHDGLYYSASEVHFRPTASPVSGTPFWPAGTTVTVSGALAGLNYGDGTTGNKDFHLTFKIRPQALVIKADAKTHQVTVTRDGQTIATYATTLKPDEGQIWSTPPGIHIIGDKVANRVSPDSAAYNETWSMRLGNTGSALHSGAPTRYDIGLTTADAKALFQLARYGDPVIVTNTLGQIDPIYDVNDWNLTAEQWTAKSLSTK